MSDFARVNEVYGEFFGGDDPPARVAVAVAALPKGADVEIDAIVRALLGPLAAGFPSARIWKARKMSFTPWNSAQIPANTSST